MACKTPLLLSESMETMPLVLGGTAGQQSASHGQEVRSITM